MATQAIPGGGQAFAPGAGSLTVAPGGSGSKRVIAAARKAPVFTTIKKTLKAATVVPLSFKLSKAAKKTYKQKHKLTLTLKITFKPAGGGNTTTRTTKLVLRPAPHVIDERQICLKRKKKDKKIQCPKLGALIS